MSKEGSKWHKATYGGFMHQGLFLGTIIWARILIFVLINIFNCHLPAYKLDR